ncbi:uncharacterized protein [Periplaneta americana]|uniref:uncharacterized protein n=1 Tax=Periplaneta americana TaxID=6978 RepID=UPI0037E74C02
MGNCCHPFGLMKATSSVNQQNRKIVLLLVGLDNAGKTTAAKNLVGEPVDSVVPTVGFSSVSLTHRGYSVVIYDLGGGPQIRGIWHRYFVDVHGVIFVVDASDVSRFEEGRNVLETLLAHGKLAGKPVLLLANKQDREGALDELDIVEQLNVEAVVNEYRCPTLVEMCSATVVKNSRGKVDPAIHNGFKWLMNRIIRDYSNLNSRVESDVLVQRKQEEQEKKERLERIRKAREERGENATGDCTSNGNCVDGVHDDSDSDVVMENPFKPISCITQNIKPAAVPIVPQLPDNKVILVKELPKRAEPECLENLNSYHSGVGEELKNVGGDASPGSKGSSRPGSGDRHWFGSPVRLDHLPSPSHSITGLIKDQLELESGKHKKRHFLHRTNRTAPAPLGPPASKGKHSLNDSNINGLRIVNQVPESTRPVFLRKQAFVEEISTSQEFPMSSKRKSSVDKASQFLIRSSSAKSSNDKEKESINDRSKKKPHLGDLKLKNVQVQPGTTDTNLSNSFSGGYQPQIEADQVIDMRQFSTNSSSLPASRKGSQDVDTFVFAVPTRQWAIDKTSLSSEDTNKISRPLTDTVTVLQSGINNLNNAQHSNQQKLKKQSSVDEISSASSKSHSDSQKLSDSGFVSPKNVLPPIRPTSSIAEKPPWILPPLLSPTKHTSQDSTTNLDNHNAKVEVSVSHDSSSDANKEEQKEQEEVDKKSRT